MLKSLPRAPFGVQVLLGLVVGVVLGLVAREIGPVPEPDNWLATTLATIGSSFVALLRAIAYGWQQETIARNAQEISDLGRQLYDRISKLAEHFETVGRSLARSVQAYNNAVGALESRVLVTARRLKDKGVSAPEAFPEPETIDQTPRPLGAPELVGLFDDEPIDGLVVEDR